MNVNEAVKDKANYSSIVTYFKNLKTLSPDDMVRLIDVIEVMSEEIFEHYKALCDMCREELQQINEHCEASQRRQLAYVLDKACAMKIVHEEKYQDLAAELNRNL